MKRRLVDLQFPVEELDKQLQRLTMASDSESAHKSPVKEMLKKKVLDEAAAESSGQGKRHSKQEEGAPAD
jgi:hypothetical protein